MLPDKLSENSKYGTGKGSKKLVGYRSSQSSCGNTVAGFSGGGWKLFLFTRGSNLFLLPYYL